MPLRALFCYLLLVEPFSGQAAEGEVTRQVEAWLGAAREARPALAAEAFASQPLGKAEAGRVQQLLWDDHVAMVRATRKAEFELKRLQIGALEMRYLTKTFGEKPAGGRSLFISMHGGGNAPARLNDSQWQNQIELYQPEEGIYLAPRAPTNTWNLWHQSHIDAFLDRLIENLIVFEGVDPDRVYLMGYSAGGDGVYQLAPRMADRFAAAAMMAGHPNETVPLGLLNLPFTLHVGGEDSAYRRNEIVPEWEKQLDALEKEYPGGYIHEAKVHEGRPHWMDLEDRVAVPWMAKFSRRRLPERVIWKQDDVTHTRFYWLGIPEGSVKPRQLLKVKRDGQRFTIEEAEAVDSVTVFLNDAMLDMDQPVVVEMGGEEFFNGKVKRTVAEIHRSMAVRGAPADGVLWRRHGRVAGGIEWRVRPAPSMGCPSGRQGRGRRKVVGTPRGCQSFRGGLMRPMRHAAIW